MNIYIYTYIYIYILYTHYQSEWCETWLAFKCGQAVGPAPAPKTTVTAVTEDAALPSVGSLGHANGRLAARFPVGNWPAMAVDCD